MPQAARIFLYILSGLMILLLVVSIVIDPIAKSWLEKQVSGGNKGQYSLELDEVKISLIRGNIKLYGIQFKTDTSDLDDVPIVFTEADEISASGISWLYFLFHDELKVNELLLDNVKIGLTGKPLIENRKKPFKLDQFDVYDDVKKYINKFRLENLSLSNLDFTLVNITSKDTLKFEAGEFNIESNDILIDADKLFTNSRALYASRIDLKGNNFYIKRTGNNHWQTEIRMLSFDTRENKMEATVQDCVFLNKALNQKDTSLFISLNDFSLDDLDLQNLQENEIADIGRISLSDLEVINNLSAQAKKEVIGAQWERNFDFSTFSLGDNLPEIVKEIRVDELALDNVNLSHGQKIRVKELNLNLGRTILNRNPAFSQNQFFHAKQFNLRINAIEIPGDDSFNNFMLNNLGLEINNGVGTLNAGFISANNSKKKHGSPDYKGHINGLDIYEINTTQLPQKNFSVDSIAIKDPSITVQLDEASPRTSSGNFSQDLDLYNAVEGILQEIRINKIAFINGDVRISAPLGKGFNAHFPKSFVQLNEVKIAKGTAFSDGRIMHTSDIAIRLEKPLYRFSNNRFFVHSHLFTMSTYEKTLDLGNLTYGHNEDIKQILDDPQVNQVFEVNVQHLLLQNIEFQRLLENKEVIAGALAVDDLKVSGFQDNNKPFAKKDEEKPFIKELIKNLDAQLYLGNIEVNKADIRFEQLAEGADTAGVITIQEANLSAENFTNIGNILRANPEIKLDLNGKIMGHGYFETQIIVPMLPDKKPISVMGSLDSMDLTKFNQMARYTSIIAIESGNLYQVNWNFTAGKEQSKGEFEIAYENLNLQLSNEESADTTGAIDQLGSFIANELIVDTDIAEGLSEEPKKVDFEQERDKEKGFIGYYLDSLLAGFKEVIGMPF